MFWAKHINYRYSLFLFKLEHVFSIMRYRWDSSIKICLEEINYENENCIVLSPLFEFCGDSNEPLCTIKTGNTWTVHVDFRNTLFMKSYLAETKLVMGWTLYVMCCYLMWYVVLSIDYKGTLLSILCGVTVNYDVIIIGSYVSSWSVSKYSL